MTWGRGRWSVSPRILAVVMVLQRLEGLSDREAVDRFGFDVRWKYAAGGLDFDHPSFVHTVLVGVPVGDRLLGVYLAATMVALHRPGLRR